MFQFNFFFNLKKMKFFFYFSIIASCAFSFPLSKLSRQQIIEFNNTNLEHTLSISKNEYKVFADYLQFQLDILNLSVRLQNKQAFEKILDQLPETFFFTKTFDFMYNISLFILEIKEMDSYIDTVMMLVQYQEMACDLSQVYSGDLWITKNGKLCFSMYSTYFTDDFLKHLYRIFKSQQYLPVVFIEEVIKQNSDIMNYLIRIDSLFANNYQRFFLQLLF